MACWVTEKGCGVLFPECGVSSRMPKLLHMPALTTGSRKCGVSGVLAPFLLRTRGVFDLFDLQKPSTAVAEGLERGISPRTPRISAFTCRNHGLSHVTPGCTRPASTPQAEQQAEQLTRLRVGLHPLETTENDRKRLKLTENDCKRPQMDANARGRWQPATCPPRPLHTPPFCPWWADGEPRPDVRTPSVEGAAGGVHDHA